MNAWTHSRHLTATEHELATMRGLLENLRDHMRDPADYIGKQEYGEYLLAKADLMLVTAADERRAA